MTGQNNHKKEQKYNGNGSKPSPKLLLALCRSFFVLLGLATSNRPTQADVRKALDGLQDLLHFYGIQLVGTPGDIVPFDPEIHFCNKEVGNRVRMVTPAFFLETPHQPILIRKAFVEPAAEKALACFYFDVICEGCFTGSYLYAGPNRLIVDSFIALQAHMRVQCPKCGKPAGCRLPYSPGPNFDLQTDPLSLVEPEDVEPGATVILKKRSTPAELFWCIESPDSFAGLTV